MTAFNEQRVMRIFVKLRSEQLCKTRLFKTGSLSWPQLKKKKNVVKVKTEF